MPFVNVKLVDGVFSNEEKHAMAREPTDVMVKYEGSEAFHEVVWVLIEELHTDGWYIGGRPFAGPRSLMENLQHSKTMFETIDGHPSSREDFSKAMPVRSASQFMPRQNMLNENYQVVGAGFRSPNPS
jgi:4-oxalocrotonate tautomerase